MKPRGILMIEHRLIEKVLSLVKGELFRIEASGGVDPYFVYTVIDFIRTYADRTHHGKEEDILFDHLKEKAMNPSDSAMMADLVQEHITARQVVSELLAANDGYKGGNMSNLATIKAKLLFLADFYPVHIAKEDKVFFPNADRYFSQKEQDDMLAAFDKFDRQMIHEKYNNTYLELRRRYS